MLTAQSSLTVDVSSKACLYVGTLALVLPDGGVTMDILRKVSRFLPQDAPHSYCRGWPERGLGDLSRETQAQTPVTGFLCLFQTVFQMKKTFITCFLAGISGGHGGKPSTQPSAVVEGLNIVMSHLS